jgi:outer membrane receptor protein involved in Fe transport
VFTLNQADQQGISGYNSGNPDLKAEKGRSTTVGLVVTPRGIPMLQVHFHGRLLPHQDRRCHRRH